MFFFNIFNRKRFCCCCEICVSVPAIYRHPEGPEREIWAGVDYLTAPRRAARALTTEPSFQPQQKVNKVLSGEDYS